MGPAGSSPRQVGTRPVGDAAILTTAVVFMAAAGLAAITAADVPVAGWFYRHRSDAVDILALLLTSLGSSQAAWVIAMILAGRASLSRQWREAVFPVLAVGGGAFLNSLLKNFFQRPRPDFGPPPWPFDGFSFPSGHAMTATILYATVATIVLRRFAGARSPMVVVGPMAVLVAVIALTRLVLRAHYLTDVLTGISVGLLWFAAARRIVEGPGTIR